MHQSNWFRTSMTILAIMLAHSPEIGRAATNGAITRVEIIADDMCCKGCAQKVAAQLYAAPGVTSVEADVPNRKLVITAKPSPKLTLDRLWKAVEQGKGGPSKLVTTDATYILVPRDRLESHDRLPAGRYSLLIHELQDKEDARKIANPLYAIPGVKSVSVDLAKNTLFLQSSHDPTLSPWLLATAVKQAGGEPLAIGGPHGMLTIEWTTPNDTTTAARSYPITPNAQGDIR